MSASRLARLAACCLVLLAASSIGQTQVAEGVAAGTVSVSGSVLTYTAASDVPNDLVIALQPGPDRYRITESAEGGISAGTGCVIVDASQADCNLAGITTLNLSVGIGDTVVGNTVDLQYVAPGDTANVIGGTSSDWLTVGDGDISAFGAVSFASGGGGNQNLWIEDRVAVAPTTYTLTASTLSRPGFGGLTYDVVTNFQLAGGLGDDQFNINSTAAGTGYSVDTGSNDANDTVTIGAGDFGLIDGYMTVYDFGGTDSLIVNDSGTPGSDDYTTTSGNNLYRTGAAGFTYFGFESVTLNAQQGSNTFYVGQTDPATPIVINGNGGDDEFVIWQDQYLFPGPVTFNGGGGTDTATVNLSPFSEFYPGMPFTLSTSSITSPAFGGLTYSGVEAIALFGGAMADTFTVNSMTASLSIDALGGADTVLLANGTLDTITSSVSVDGGTESDAITLRDQSHAGNDTYTYTRDSINRPTFGQLDYLGMETLTVNAGPGNNTINIGTTEEGVANFVNSGGGDDAFFITAGGIGIATTESTTLDGGPHTTGDTLTMYDGGLTVVDNGAGTITTTGPSRQPVFYSNIENRSTPPSFDTDGDGCSDVAEGGDNELFGGDRNPLDPWDFYDVNGTKAVTLSDTLLILEHFGHAHDGDGLDPFLDRYVPDLLKPWRSAGALNGITLADALANLRSFGHSCV